jgi:hypothetical protein
MHDDHIGLRPRHARGGHTEGVEVLPDRREERPLHAFLLDPQHHDDVRTRDRLVHRRSDVDAVAVESDRHQGARPADPHVGAELGQQQDVGAKHAAVHQVADDRHLQPRDASLPFADGEGVEQRLRRMLVHAVSGVDDSRAAQAREHVAGAG